MTREIVDYFNTLKRYERQKELFKQRTDVSQKNKDLVLKWLDRKHKMLIEGKDTTQVKRNELRNTKTLIKYLFLLGNVVMWFKDLSNVTKEDLTQFKEDFYKDKIRSKTGKVIKGKRDYIVKVFKSDFFRRYLKLNDIVEEVFSYKVDKPETEVDYITEEEFHQLIKTARYNYHRAIFYLMYSSGVRIGELVNIRKQDFRLKQNPDTNIDFYLLTIKADITKSKKDRTIPIIMEKANQSIKDHLSKLEDGELFTTLHPRSILQAIQEYCKEANIRTNNGKLPTCHTLRKSCTTYLANQGYNLLQVKKVLGHKPSSTVIDKYFELEGLDLQPTVTKAQNNDLIKLQKDRETQDQQMLVLQQKMIEMAKDLEIMRDAYPDHIRKTLGVK